MERREPGKARVGPEPSVPPFRRILLVGFMGSGKSTVGPLLARALHWRFEDLDQAVERRSGRSVARIFEEEGEESFREVEDSTARELLEEVEIVLASGGGWPCREGRMESVGADTLTLWLRVSPEAAFERIRGQAIRRPLLEVERPLVRIRELLAEREPHYRKALWWVDTEGLPPEAVVGQVIGRLRTAPERPLRN